MQIIQNINRWTAMLNICGFKGHKEVAQSIEKTLESRQWL